MKPRLRTLRSVRLAMAVASIALTGGCDVGNNPPVNTRTSFDGVVHLTRQEPVAVRHLAFEVSPPTRPMNVTLTIKAHRFVTEMTGEFAEDVTLSVRPDDPATAAHVGSPGGARPGAIVDMTELCSTGCESGAMVVVRGTSDERPTEDIAISAELLAVSQSSYWDDKSPLGTTLSIVDDGGAAFEGDPPAITADVAPTIVVSEASRSAHVTLRLRADPELLTDPLAYPLVGSLTLRARGDAAAHEQLWNHSGRWIGRVTVGGEEMGMAPESAAHDIDWLRYCTSGEPCEVEVGVDIDYEDLVFRARLNRSANESAGPPPAEFRLTLDALARLEAFDGRDLAGDGLTLEVAD